MLSPYWQKQKMSKPLFPDLLWSRPENRAAAGKLLIIGGNLHGFAVPAEAYAQALKAGVGIAKVLLPDATKRLIGPIMETGEFAPSTPSGSFSKQALADFLDHGSWADGVLLAGELGRNSETAILLEQFIDKYIGQLTLTRDAVDYFKNLGSKLLSRPKTTLVLSLAQLQKLVVSLRSPQPITLGMDLIKLVEILHDLSFRYSCNLIVKQYDQIIVACGGSVSSTKLPDDRLIWRVHTASNASVWWLQNPARPFEALTSALLDPEP